MRRIIFTVLMLTTLVRESAHAMPEAQSLGLGVMVGSASAVTGKFWIIEQGAVDFGVEFMDHPWSVLYADFLWHVPELFGKSSRFARETALYFGAGAGVGFWDRTDTCGRWDCRWKSNSTGSGTGMFLRAVLGMEWYPRRTRFGIFAELDPTYLWYPSSVTTYDAAVGGRYYF